MPVTPAGLVITACTALVHDEEEEIGFREDAAIVVRDRVVESVTTAASVRDRPAAVRIDAYGQVAVPGLINCPTHAPVVSLRGPAGDLPTGIADGWVLMRDRRLATLEVPSAVRELTARLPAPDRPGERSADPGVRHPGARRRGRPRTARPADCLR